MKRREFIQKAAAGAVAGGLLAGCAKSQSGPAVQTHRTVRWRLASSYPPSLDTIFGAAEAMAERVRNLTEGRFDIRVYPQGELVPGLQVLDAVQQNTTQMGHSASYYYIGKNPIFAFDTTVPFGLTARQQTAWLHEGGGLELLRELFAKYDVLNYPGGNTGVQMGGWFRREIHSLADLKGLKMRIPGMGGEVMSRLGVTVQVLAGGDIFPALERGVIDATEWVGPYDDEKLGFYKAASHYYYPGWWEPGPTLSYYVNRKAWESLPSVFREALEAAMAESDQNMLAKYDARNPAALKRLLEKGVKLHPFSEEIMSAARREMDEKFADLSGKDPAYSKVFSHWSRFREETFRWFGSAEQAFARFAFAST